MGTEPVMTQADRDKADAAWKVFRSTPEFEEIVTEAEHRSPEEAIRIAFEVGWMVSQAVTSRSL